MKKHIVLLSVILFTVIELNAQQLFLDKAVYESAAELEAQHPSQFYQQAMVLYGDNKINEAGFLFYLGQLRYRYYVSACPDVDSSGDGALLASLNMIAGESINFSLGDSVENIIKVIDAVLVWDKTHDFLFYSKKKSKKKYAEILEGLEKLKQQVVDNKEDMIIQHAEEKSKRTKYKQVKQVSYSNKYAEIGKEAINAIQKLQNKQPYDYFVMAKQFLDSNKNSEAAFIFYVGDMKHSYKLSIDSISMYSKDSTSFLKESLRPKIDTYLSNSDSNQFRIFNCVISWISNDKLFQQEITNGIGLNPFIHKEEFENRMNRFDNLMHGFLERYKSLLEKFKRD